MQEHDDSSATATRGVQTEVEQFCSWKRQACVMAVVFEEFCSWKRQASVMAVVFVLASTSEFVLVGPSAPLVKALVCVCVYVFVCV